MKGFGLPEPSAMRGKATGEIERIVDSLNIAPEGNLEPPREDEANVAAIQLPYRRYASLPDYIFDMNLYVADAVNRRAHLVCFPAFCGMLPLPFLVPEKAAASLWAEFPSPGTLHEILSRYGDSLYDVFATTMSLLASRHRVFLMAGTIPFFDGDTLYHRALLFSDTGGLAGFQDKLSLTAYEQDAGFTAATELRAFPTPAGTISILTGSDGDYCELGRIAKQLGSRILVGPALFLEESTPVRAALGLNMRVQENTLYGVQSVLTGDPGFGAPLQGTARIFAPGELMRSKNGILAQADPSQEPGVVCRTLNLERLTQVKNPYTQDTNPDLMRAYLNRFF